MTIDGEKRRMIFERARQKGLARGMPIDEDPEFLTSVELWVLGEIEMSELRCRYNSLVTQRARWYRSLRQAHSAQVDATGPQDGLLTETQGGDVILRDDD
ncbi:hypothetical protein ACRQ1B_17160 [Rhizobium panacihumi]|uniref:hypothetical protein n=1 Tax=Rhizobium panacihumi TaxID=2008450 RepID=UPI003D7926B6